MKKNITDIISICIFFIISICLVTFTNFNPINSSSSKFDSSTNSSSSSNTTSSVSTSLIDNKPFTFDNKTKYIVGQKFADLGYVDRKIPTTMSNGGLTRYPNYGTSLPNITDEEKTNLINECNNLLTNTGTYDEIDKDGNYLLNGELTGKKLYKHTASVNMYEGNVSNTQKAIIRKIMINPLVQRNYLTGLYIPAGEIAKLEISQEDLDNIGSLTVYVGQVAHRNTINNIWSARNDFSRMPTIVNSIKVKSTTTYLANPFGGPIFLYPEKLNEFEVTISGAIEYFCYIHGYTTEEDVIRMKDLSAPYYDFELWNNGIRFSGPKSRGNFDYDNLVKVGDLWEKVCLTSAQVPAYFSNKIGIGFIFDCFVAAGEAVAFVGGRMAVNAPLYWMNSSLDYENIIRNGMWGTFHEYNHHFQRYGMEKSSSNEVTNNATTLLSYILYTDISSSRSENDNDLSGWNRFLDPSRCLKETNNGSVNLNTYADLIHSFGVEKFIEMANNGANTFTDDSWFDACSKATNYNLSYYFENMLKKNISNEIKEKYQKLPLFIPCASLYQVGRTYIENNKEVEFETVKPYLFNKNQDYILDFEKNIVVPNGFTYEIKEISNPQYGKLKKISNKKYQYYFDNNVYSGNFYLTLNVSNGEINEEVKLIINVGIKDSLPEKTMYTYSSRIYSLPDEALNNNFANYIDKQTTYVRSTFMNQISNNKIGYLNGKIYIYADGEYTFCLRAGRGNHALYISLDGDNYTKKLEFSGDKSNFEIGNDHTFNINLKKGDYLYYKQITISNNHPDAYTELGWALNNGNVVAVQSNYLYSVNYKYVPGSFISKEVYQRKTELNYNYQNNINKQKIISINQDPWDSNKSDNMLDGDENTYYHSSQNDKLTSDHPFEMVMDLGENKYWNTITFIGRNTGINHLPTKFILYVGDNESDLHEIANYESTTIQGKTATVKFKTTKFRYFKIHVTETSSSNPNKYVCLSRVNVSYQESGYGESCDKFTYIGNWKEYNDKLSLFNHYIQGNGQAKYELKQIKHLSLYALENNNCKLKININNEEYIIETNDKLIFSYDFDNLEDVEIKIEILSGTLSLDSFTYF